MNSRRRKQLSIILILVATIASVSIGFAAFSTVLTISSSATVAPNDSNFSVVFSSAEDSVTTTETGIEVEGTGINGAKGGIESLTKTSVSGLVANLTEPGQSLSTTVYVHNTGHYDAYLRGVTISNVSDGSPKVCTANTGTTNSLVQAACNGINVSITINGVSYQLGNNEITNHMIPKGTSQPLVITITYNENSSRADGDFEVEFGDISVEYSTVDRQIELISFTINRTTYQGESDMTLEQWINSSYNTSSYTDLNDFCTPDTSAGDAPDPYDGAIYLAGNSCPI